MIDGYEPELMFTIPRLAIIRYVVLPVILWLQTNPCNIEPKVKNSEMHDWAILLSKAVLYSKQNKFRQAMLCQQRL